MDATLKHTNMQVSLYRERATAHIHTRKETVIWANNYNDEFKNNRKFITISLGNPHDTTHIYFDNPDIARKLILKLHEAIEYLEEEEEVEA